MVLYAQPVISFHALTLPHRSQMMAPPEVKPNLKAEVAVDAICALSLVRKLYLYLSLSLFCALSLLLSLSLSLSILHLSLLGYALAWWTFALCHYLLCEVGSVFVSALFFSPSVVHSWKVVSCTGDIGQLGIG